MKLVALGERQRATHKLGQALAQGVVPAFDMRRLAAALARGAVLRGGDDLTIASGSEMLLS